MRLKEVRQQHKMTQKQVAEMLGIPVRTYQNYERGVNDPDTDVLLDLADFFDVTVDYLVGYSDIARATYISLSEDESHLVDTYRTLDEPGKKAVITLAEGLSGASE